MPWINSKAEADSYKIEIEMKNQTVFSLRSDLNKTKKELDDSLEKIDQLVRKIHKAEELGAKVIFTGYGHGK